MSRICFVTTTAFIARAFLLGHARHLAGDHQLLLLLNTQDRYASALEDFPQSLRISHVALTRGVNPLRALQALLAMIMLFRRERIDIVQSLSPQAGIVTMLAAWCARVPIRVHMYTGQTWATKRGLLRGILMLADRLIAVNATHLLADSRSQRDFLVEQGIVSAAKIAVLADGSVAGVDLKRFSPSATQCARIRAEHGIGETDTVYLYLGRINREKGLLELAEAFARLQTKHPTAFMLIVGPDEGDLLGRVRQTLGPAAARMAHVGFTTSPEAYIAAANIICLPSYREGFGSVLIEAAAMGVPAIASRIYGITDAVVEGDTGLLHAPADVDDLYRAMRRCLDEPGLVARMGERAQARAKTIFPSARVEQALAVFYRERLDEYASLQE